MPYIVNFRALVSDINIMKIDLQTQNYYNMMRAQKALEEAVKLPQEILEQSADINNKMLKVNVTQKVQGKIDIYA